MRIVGIFLTPDHQKVICSQVFRHEENIESKKNVHNMNVYLLPFSLSLY